MSVLQLIAGLPKCENDTIATIIQQADPLPSFHKPRSQLLLEETRRLRQVDHSQVALVASHSPTPTSTTAGAPLVTDKNSRGNDGLCGGRGRGKSNWRGDKGKGRGRGNNANGGNSQHNSFFSSYGTTQQPTTNSYGPPGPKWQQQSYRASPPCPYLTLLPLKTNVPL